MQETIVYAIYLKQICYYSSIFSALVLLTFRPIAFKFYQVIEKSFLLLKANLPSGCQTISTDINQLQKIVIFYDL